MNEPQFPWAVCLAPVALLLLVTFWSAARSKQARPGDKTVTFTCLRCRHVERHRDEDLDWMHAAAAVCPRCGGQQTIS